MSKCRFTFFIFANKVANQFSISFKSICKYSRLLFFFKNSLNDKNKKRGRKKVFLNAYFIVFKIPAKHFENIRYSH